MRRVGKRRRRWEGGVLMAQRTTLKGKYVVFPKKLLICWGLVSVINIRRKEAERKEQEEN